MDVENTIVDVLPQREDDPGPSPAGRSRWGGRLFIFFILLLSIAMGGFAVWFKYQEGRQCLTFWGSHNAGLIRHASTVELQVLSPDASPAELQAAVESGSLQLPVKENHDISDVPGLVHARHMLIEDQTYRWNEAAGKEPPGWSFALCFREEEEEIVLAFDTSRRLVQLVGSQQPVVMGRMLGQLEKYLGLENPLPATN
jgi:hypothetical protein